MLTKFGIIYFLICLPLSNSQEELKHHKRHYNDNDYHSLTIIYRNYMESMLNIVDWNIKPCDNFFQHACGYFPTATCAKMDKLLDKSNARYGFPNCQLAPYLYNQQDRFQFFVQAKDSFSTKPGRVLRNLYDLCTRLNHNASTGYKFRMLLHQMEFFHKHRQCLSRKWPFMPNEQHKCVRRIVRNWLRTAAELAAHGLQTFVAVSFANHTIYITTNHQLQCWNRNELSALIRKLSKSANAPDVNLIANELGTFCQQLKNITIHGPNKRDEKLLRNCHVTNSSGYKSNNFLEDGLWLDYMSHYLQRLEFNEMEILKAGKIISHSKHLSQIAELLKCSQPRIIYNFLIWQMLKELDVNDCYNLIVENFERSLLIEYWNWNVFHVYFQRDRLLTSYILYIIKFRQQHQLYQKTKQWPYPLSRSKRSLHLQYNDLQLIEALQSYAQEHLANTKFHDSESYTNATQFYSLLLSLKRYQIRSNFFETSHTVADSMKDVLDDDDENGFYYILLKEFIWFTILLINRPLLHFYATQNREMWSRSGLLFTTDGLYTSFDCLLKQGHIEAESSGLYKQLLEQQMLDVYKFYKAFAATKSDYEFWLDGEVFAISEDFILDYFQINSHQIMFYAVAQQYCGRNNEQFSYMINRSYMNYPDFDSIFNCTAHSDAMSPQHKCTLDL